MTAICTLKIFVKLFAAVCGFSFLMFVFSLASEDQRNFISCRAEGGSADACLLLINGR